MGSESHPSSKSLLLCLELWRRHWVWFVPYVLVMDTVTVWRDQCWLDWWYMMRDWREIYPLGRDVAQVMELGHPEKGRVLAIWLLIQ